MKLYVGVTDNEWFRFLRDLAPDEVNFWRPGGGSFKVLEPGAPFLFKLHAPEHCIAGGGFFLDHVRLPVSLAWKTFGEKNGAPSFLKMRDRIEHYRRNRSDQGHDFEIGCILLTDPFFFAEEDWIPAPEDWKPGIMQGKSYDTDEPVGGRLWARVSALLARHRAIEPRRRVAERPLVPQPRLQLTEGAFRILVTEAYERRCAITRQPVLPTLDATHIKPVSAGGEHRVDNGLLLRADICHLFDQGYVTIAKDCSFRASQRIRDEFHNGEEYFRLDGSPLWVPRNAAEQPNRELLEWHSDVVFRG